MTTTTVNNFQATSDSHVDTILVASKVRKSVIQFTIHARVYGLQGNI